MQPHEVGLRDLALALRECAVEPSFMRAAAVAGTAYAALVGATSDMSWLITFALVGLILLDAICGYARARKEGKASLRRLWVLTFEKALKYTGATALLLICGFYADILNYAAHDDGVGAFAPVFAADAFLLGIVFLSTVEIGSCLNHLDALTEGNLRDMLGPAHAVLAALESFRQRRSVTATDWRPVAELAAEREARDKGAQAQAPQAARFVIHDDNDDEQGST